MMKKVLFALAISLTFLVTHISFATESSIAAIVNNEVITKLDVQNRLKLMLIGQQTPDDKNVKSHLEKKILQSLIDEALQNQAAEKMKVVTSQQEIDTAMQRVAKGNNLTVDKLENILKQSKVDKKTLQKRLASEINWAKTTSKKFYGKINVSEFEVEDLVSQIKTVEGKTEYHIAEIFIPLNEKNDSKEAKNLAQKILSEIKNGAPFQNLAHSFSQSATAARGGDLGWTEKEQLSPEVASSLDKIEVGKVSQIISTSEGYTIIYLINKRVNNNLNTDSNIVDSKDIKNKIAQKKIDIKAKQYLRELRDSAFIDIRM